MATRIRNHVRGNVLGFLALFLVLSTGSALALNGSNTVFSDDIVNGQVKTPDLGANAVVTAKVTDNSLTGADINESTLAGLWKLGGNAGITSSDFLGTTDNKPLNLRVNNARGLRLEPASDGTNQSPNVIGGIADNSVSAGAYAATIAGGGRFTAAIPSTANQVTDSFGTVGGGADNQAGDGAGTVGDRPLATVAGGSENTASGVQSTVGGGGRNIASGNRATVVGGFRNTAQGDFSLAGGADAKANHEGAFVWADSLGLSFPSTAPNQFSVRSTGGARLVSGVDGSGSPTTGLELPAGASGWSTIANGQSFDVRVNGARGLRIDPASDGTNQSPNVIGGTAANQVAPGVHSAVIGGGGRGTPADPTTANRVTDHQGTIGGGANNQAGDNAGTVGDATLATVGGGGNNVASGEAATVGGGFSNSARGFHSTVGGGDLNVADALADFATASGGLANTASGSYATVPGGRDNIAAGEYSLAAGHQAKANHFGSFVWADSKFFDFASTAADQFSARATGGVRFVSAVDGSGNPTAGVTLAPGGGSWASLSDEASKTAVTPVSGREVLRRLASVPISEWSYRAQGPSVRHIGPMAQDLSRAFGVGEDSRHITSVDADGISLAAIKGLQSKLRVERRRRQALERRLNGLEARLAALERQGAK